jgi:hypothetical protein
MYVFYHRYDWDHSSGTIRSTMALLRGTIGAALVRDAIAASFHNAFSTPLLPIFTVWLSVISSHLIIL